MNQSKRERKLLINSILYFFGSLGKGVASIFVVFIGSFFISPSDMGIYDLVVSTITLLQPIIIFQLNDGIYRWLLDGSLNKIDTIRTGYRIVGRNLIIANIIMIALLPFLEIQYSIYVLILVNINCIYPVFQQITRGYKNHKVFALSGVVNALIIIGLTSWLLYTTDLGVGSFYIAQIAGNMASVIYLMVSQRLPYDIWKKPDPSIYKLIGKPMQRYSILLVPNSINQWIMKALDKYCILFFLNPYYNGIYTVAHRFPDILIMLNNMFYSAWVEQSIVEYDSSDRDVYFSKIFNMYSSILICVVLIITPVTKYFIQILIGSEYYDAYQYVPFLYVAVIFSGLSSFIGTGYLGIKKTEGIMWTSLSGALVNALINVTLMKKYGLQIAGASSILAYATMFIMRIIQTKKYFTIRINYYRFIPLISTAMLFSFLVQLNNGIIDIVMECIALILFWIFNKNLVMGVVRGLKLKLNYK